MTIDLKFLDSFDHYNTVAVGQLKGWVYTGTPAWITGRFGALAMRHNNTSQNIAFSAFGVSNLQSGYIGVSFQKNTGASGYANATVFLQLLDDTTIHLYLRANADGTISIVQGNNTVLATSTKTIILDTWYAIEFRWSIADSTSGQVELYVNGVQWAVNNACDSRNGANAYVTNAKLIIGSNVGYGFYDNFYVLGSSGAFIGDSKIEALYPSGAGSSTQWTPSAGSNYACVDETPPNGDTDYVSSSTVDQVDTYACGNLSTVSGYIYGTQLGIYARKDDAGDRRITSRIKSGATDHDGTEFTLATSYTYNFDLDEQDPAGGDWTVSSVNAIEIGQKLST